MKHKESFVKIFELPESQRIFIPIIKASWHKEIMNELLNSAVNVLEQNGFCSVERYKRLGELAIPKTYEYRQYQVFEVPGTYEIPLAVKWALSKMEFPSGDVNFWVSGIITLGTVIKGETDHNFYINTAVSRKLMELMTEYGIPIGFGIITANNYQQAKERSSKGQEATEAVLQMLQLKQEIFQKKKKKL